MDVHFSLRQSTEQGLYFFKKERVFRENNSSYLLNKDSVSHTILFFKNMREQNKGLIVLTTSDDPHEINRAYEKLKLHEIQDYPILKTGHTLSAYVELTNDMNNLIKELAQGDTMITLYQREGIVVFCESEDVFDVNGYNVSDCHVWSDLTGETIPSLFLGDIFERLIHKDSSIAAVLNEHLDSLFIMSWLDPIFYPESTDRITLHIHHSSKYVETLYPLLLKVNEMNLWDHPFQVIYWFILERSDENVQ